MNIFALAQPITMPSGSRVMSERELIERVLLRSARPADFDCYKELYFGEMKL